MKKTSDNQLLVLIVDDKEENLIAMEATLKGMDIGIVKAISGEEALQKSTLYSFTLILLDVQMPGMDGFETATVFHNMKRTQDIPIIFVTAISKTDNFVLKGYEAGAVDYLFKPINPSVLKNKVRVFLQLEQQKRELLKQSDTLEQCVRLRTIDLEQEIRERRLAEGEAKKSNQAKSEFLSSMSHELRTPLNSILGFAQLLDTDIEAPLNLEQKENVGFIIDSGEYLLALINEILSLSTIESGKVSFSNETICLNNLINDIIPLMKSLASQNNVEIKSLISDMDVSINTDSTRLKQILLNLIGNAVKYNKENGKVSIDAVISRENIVKISVIDTGVGISENYQDNVFSEFERLGHNNSRIPGIGIGLFVTKKLIELMGGNIGFNSIEGKGSTFWFELPIEQDSR